MTLKLDEQPLVGNHAGKRHDVGEAAPAYHALDAGPFGLLDGAAIRTSDDRHAKIVPASVAEGDGFERGGDTLLGSEGPGDEDTHRLSVEQHPRTARQAVELHAQALDPHLALGAAQV